MSRRQFIAHHFNVNILVVDKGERILQLKINYAKVIVKVVNGLLCSRCCSGANDVMFIVSGRYAMKNTLKK